MERTKSKDRRALSLLLVAFLFASGARAALAQCTRDCGGAAPASRHAPESPPAAVNCTTDAMLCLSGGRFLITATWTKPDGEAGAAHAVALTPDSGYFWFLEPDNVEVTVKLLDGCAVDGHDWFFAAGLTNLEVLVTVTDLFTNTSKNYFNRQGTAFQP